MARRCWSGEHMRILVASSNIFRRELTGFTLAEAGFAVAEASDLAGLLAALDGEPPLVLVLDPQIGGDAPGALLDAVRLRVRAPVLWIASDALARPLLMLDPRPADALDWPYSGDELLARVALLIGRAEADLARGPGRSRSLGASE